MVRPNVSIEGIRTEPDFIQNSACYLDYLTTSNGTLYRRLIDSVGLENLNTINGNALGNLLSGSAADDAMLGNGGKDVLRGVGGNDFLLGGAAADGLYGGSGRDAMFGLESSDRLDGGLGNDRIYGGDGDDVLIGSTGADHLNGGAGADSFRFIQGFGTDRIVDFSAGEGDLIRLDARLWGGALTVDQVVSKFGSVTGGDLLFSFRNGDQILIQGLSDLATIAESIVIL